MSSTLTFALTGLLPQTPKSGSFSNLMYAIVVFQFNIIFFYNYELNFQLDFDFQEPCLLSHIRIYNKSVLEWEIAVGLRYKVGQPFRFCLHFIYFFCVFVFFIVRMFAGNQRLGVFFLAFLKFDPEAFQVAFFLLLCFLCIECLVERGNDFFSLYNQPEAFVKVRPRCEAPRRDMIYPMNYTPCRYVRISCLRGNPIAIFFIQVYED